MTTAAAESDPALRTYLADLGIAEDALPGWKIEVARRGGEDAAIVITQGTEIHFVALQPLAHRAMSRRNISQFLAPILQEYGYATTRVPLDVEDQKLREHLGFTETWRDEQFSYWALTRLPYQRT